MARRTFLGGVEVVGVPDRALNVPLASPGTLQSAVIELGGKLADVSNDRFPKALIGDAVILYHLAELAFDMGRVAGWCGSRTCRTVALKGAIRN